MKKLKGFTLAEVLITLAVVGIVAALTLPTMISKINDKITSNSIKVFESKLIKGLNLTKTAGDLNASYMSTYDFLENGLSKNLKMVKICDGSHLRDCFSYDKIKYDKNDTTEATVKVKDLIAPNLQLDVRIFNDLGAFVLGDGTSVIVSYNKNCIVDADKADIAINKCLAGIYDLNGTRKPNKLGKDVQAFNGAGIDGAILAYLGGVKIISSPQKYDGILTSTYCDTNDSDPSNWTVKNEYSGFIKKCCVSCKNSLDYWAAAAIACEDIGGELPTRQQLADIASELYNENISFNSRYDGAIITSKIPESLNGLIGAALWSSEEKLDDTRDLVFDREFQSSYTRINYDGWFKTAGQYKSICVAK